MTPQAHSGPYKLFSLLLLGWVFWLWLGLVLALGHAFSSSLLGAGAAIIALASLWHFRKRLIVSKDTLKSILYFLLLFVLCSLFLTSFEPTVFSGRDQGSYSLAAMRLVDTHSLSFSTPASDTFFNIYGPGRALNFPGFSYTQEGELTTQFPLGYITWLASFFVLFGLNGFAIANAFTVTIFLFSFFLLLRLFVPTSFRRWGVSLAIIGFPLFWFAKFTLSENLAWALFAALALELVLFLKKEDGRTMSGLTALALAGFFVCTRIEGFAFFGITLILLLSTREARAFWKTLIRSRAVTSVVFLATFIVLLVADFFINISFYKTIGKILVEKINTIGQASQEIFSAEPFSDSLTLGVTLWHYGLLAIFIAGIVGVLVLIKRRDFIALVPFFLALPTLFYLVQPNISFDHPWMLRRFAFSVWPALLFSTIVGIAYIDAFFARRYTSIAFFQRGWYSSLLLTILFLNQLPAFLFFLPLSEQQGLYEQASSLTQEVLSKTSDTSKSLILVSRDATGDPWAMLPDTMNALFKTNTVYFFNPEDLTRIDISKFQNTYLIVSEDELPQYQSIQERLALVQPYTLNITTLKDSPGILFPQPLPAETYGYIFQVR